MISRSHHPGSIAVLPAVFPLLSSCLPLGAQDTPSPAGSGEAMTNVQFPNTPIPVILLEYERLTGYRIIRDAGIQDKNLSIQTSGKMTHAEAAEFIEKSFLLNGYAILPTEEPDQRKIIAFNTDKKPSSEGLPVITTPERIPEGDQVVTYIMPLQYLGPEEASEVFTTIVELHPYGKVTPLQNASAVVITENSSVIRRFLELRDHLDVSPQKTVDRSFQLERADADDVVEALTDLLDLDEQSEGGSSGGARNAQQQSQGDGGAAGTSSSDPGIIPSQRRGGSFYTKATAPSPRIRAIPRANRVLVVASPQDMEYIAGVIEHLDAPVETSRFLRRKLHYIAVSDFLQIAGDIIQRGLGGEDSSQGQISGGQQENGERREGLNATDQNRSLGGSGLGAEGRASSSTVSLGNAGSDAAAAPQSIVIDKTLLIADNVQNMLIASGPPEHLRLIGELLDSMDVRPEQIQISAVIAQLNLGDDYEFGFDLLRSFESPADGTNFNGGGSFVSRTGASQNLLDVSTLTDVTNLLPASQGLTFYGQLNPYLDGFVSALESTSRFKVLSRPTVYTVNNRQATIETGQRVAVPRSTLSTADVDQDATNQIVRSSIDFENVVLRIDVVPLINSEGEITLQIQQRNDDIIGSQNIGGDEVPTIGTQALGTTVMVPDGGTVLLGGLIAEEDRKDESGVPLFTNLPLVGRVFGSTNDNVSRQELLIFIQPKIIRDDRDRDAVDGDMVDRTRVGEEAGEFSDNTDNNLDSFESQDFNSAEKRIHFFRDLFKKKSADENESPRRVRAVPVEQE